MTSIHVGVIAWRQLEAGCVYALWQLARSGADVKLDIHGGDALVERARSTLATRFLRDTTADVLLTIDSDIVFDPQQALQIAEQAHELKAIVAGVYSTRSWAQAAPASMLNDTPIEFGTDPTPVPIRWAANGFMAVDRSVLERLRDEDPEMALCHTNQGRLFEFYPFYHTRYATDDQNARILLSEDFAFCEAAWELGIPTYINPAVRLGHIGAQVFRLEHMAWKEPPPMPMRLTRQGLRYAVEADAPPALVPFVKGAPTETVHLNRAARRREERARQPVGV